MTEKTNTKSIEASKANDDKQKMDAKKAGAAADNEDDSIKLKQQDKEEDQKSPDSPNQKCAAAAQDPTPTKEDDKQEATKKSEKNCEDSPESTKPKLHLAPEYSSEDDERSHTFRQRRLTYTRHHVSMLENAAAAAASLLDLDEDEDEDEDEDDENQEVKQPAAAEEKEEKEKLDEDKKENEMTSKDKNENENENEPTSSTSTDKKRKQDGDAGQDSKQESTTSTPAKRQNKRQKKSTTPATTPKGKQRLKSRVLHAGEIKRTSPSTPTSSTAAAATTTPSPSSTPKENKGWRRKRQHRNSLKLEDEIRLLPFPRDVVGTYSCHGVEPLYDSDYEHDEEDEMEGNGNGGGEGEGATTTVAKINQDRGGVAFPYGNCSRTALFAAYDGHGEGGEQVSQYSLHEIQRRLEIHPTFNSDIDKAFQETFLAVDEELKNEEDIEPLYSGSTACVVLLRDQVLTVANCGDSRAVIGRPKKVNNDNDKDTSTDDNNNNNDTTTAAPSENDDDPYESLDLSVDQNPDSPGEQERIIENGGFVSPPPEEGLSARVWLDAGFTQIGLAMARSIGDHAVKPVGVIAEPVVTKHELTDNDEFMIIATDGVWEFISSQEAVNIVGKHLQKGEGSSKACQVLIEAAASKWHEFEGDYRDDITALVIQLKKLWGSVGDRIHLTTDDHCEDGAEDVGVKSTVV